MELKGKNVLITGSSRGIGKGIAVAFAKEKATIILNARSKISSEIIEEIKAYGVTCIQVTGNIANFDECKEMVQEVERTLGKIDILINNAGITKDQLLLRMKPEDFQDVIAVNLTGTFNMTKQVIKGMIKNKAGRIINLSSTVGLAGNVGQANYAASKAGVIGFTKSVAREYAVKGVTCNAIAPGFIETEMTAVLSEPIQAEIKRQIPKKSFGTVEDVAQTAIFLAKNSYITGQVINVDGGLVMND